MANLQPKLPRARSVIHRTLHWAANREFVVLAGLFGLLGSCLVFVLIAGVVVDGGTREFDRALLLSLRNPLDVSDPLGPRWVEEMFRDITALGSTIVLTMVTLAVAGYFLLDGRRGVAMIVLLATLGAFGVGNALKHTFDRERPDLVPHGSTVYTSSFPSSHSMVSASTFLTLGALLARVQRRRRIKTFVLGVAITATVLVGVSRVYLGVHWPTDVLAGWTAGAGWALMCWLLARWLQRRGNVEHKPPTPI